MMEQNISTNINPEILWSQQFWMSVRGRMIFLSPVEVRQNRGSQEGLLE